MNTAIKLVLAAILFTMLSGIGYAYCPDANSNWTITANYTLNTSVSCINVTVTNGATFTFSNGTNSSINATNVVLTNGTITATALSIVNITAFNLNIDQDSNIAVTGKGYAGGTTSSNGSGPGGGRLNNVAGGSASYGGTGGTTTGTFPTNSSTPYGNITWPTNFGSGGGGCANGGNGGSGGGAIILNISNILNISGNIEANGNSGNVVGSYTGGSGSGGSILIYTSSLIGNGLISADGAMGSTATSYAGAGAGAGRIAIYYNTSTFSGEIRAIGGINGSKSTSPNRGGAGTIYLKNMTSGKDLLIINNKDISTTATTNISTTVTDGKFDELIITNATAIGNTQLNITTNVTIIGVAYLGNSIIQANTLLISNSTLVIQDNAAISTSALNIINSGKLTSTQLSPINISAINISIENGSSINATGKGYAGGTTTTNGSGPGGGYLKNGAGGSASHGGVGGATTVSFPVNGSTPYGNITWPTNFGSGGGGCSNGGDGGSGGGTIILNISDMLNVSGTINADGSSGEIFSSYAGGSGSGGSILIRSSSIIGIGIISADGAMGSTATTYAGAGAGAGRIAIYYNTSTFSGEIRAIGGINGSKSTSPNRGGAGTIYLKNMTSGKDLLIINNKDISWSAATNISTTMTDGKFNELQITNATLYGNALNISDKTILRPGVISLNNPITGTSEVIIYSGAYIITAPNSYVDRYLINITASNISILPGGIINVSGLGYAGAISNIMNGSGPGFGISGTTASGASHGGLGGNSTTGTLPSNTYGNILTPLQSGSGGGAGNQIDGGAGGGVVYIAATNMLNVSGMIHANGNKLAGTGYFGGSGGAGGSILLIAQTIVGNSSISVEGGAGSGDSSFGGGGGGGRIAIYDVNNSFSGSISVQGGAAGGGTAFAGNPGTVFFCHSSSTDSCPGNIGNITLNTFFSINTSQNITRNLLTAWNNTQVIWNETATNTSTIATYAILNLTYPNYKLRLNGTFNNSLQNTNNVLESFNASISSVQISLLAPNNTGPTFSTSLNGSRNDPAKVYAGENLTCYADSTDSDDFITAASWVILNGSNIYSQGSKNISANLGAYELASVPGNLVGRSENWTCQVNVSDSYVFSAPVNVSRLTESNTMPSIASINITPSLSYSNDTLIGYCNATDVDGDTLIYYYRWYKNSALNSSGTNDNAGNNFTQGLQQTIATLAASTARPYENWTFSCSAFDGTVNSSWSNISTSIMNWIPNITSVSINSTYGYNTTAENITARPVLQDADRDAKIAYDWRLNGSSIAVVNLNFDINNSGGTNKVRDYSMFNNTVALGSGSYAPAWNATGGRNGSGAYEFFGNQTIMISNTSVPNYQSRFTISAWIKIRAYPNSSRVGEIVSKRTYSAPSWTAFPLTVYLDANGTVNFRTSKGNDYSFDGNLTSSPGLSNNTWHHIVAAYTNSSNMSLYVDGQLVNSTTINYNISVNYVNWTIGKANELSTGIGNSGFNGTIDDVVIYNRTLSTAEVSAIYQNRTDTIVSQELIVGQNWSVCTTPNDGYFENSTVCSENTTILTAPYQNCPNQAGVWVISSNYTLNTNVSCDQVIINNGATLTFSNGTNSSINATIVALNNGTISATNLSRVNITAINLTIDNSSSINVSGKGYPAITTTWTDGLGPGYGASYGSNGCAGSASYGGTSGDCGSSHNPNGPSYSDLLLPVMAGSSGGTRWSGATPSGAGGGVVFLNITGVANLSGPILADGLAGANGAAPAGAGSGGSILIFANTMVGNSFISSNGGDGAGSSYYAGGAGGGRIALYYSNFSFGGTIFAKGGAAGGGAAQIGGAGTIYLQDITTNLDSLIINNLNNSEVGITIIDTNASKTQFSYLNLTNATIVGSPLNITSGVILSPGIIVINNSLTLNNTFIITKTTLYLNGIINITKDVQVSNAIVYLNAPFRNAINFFVENNSMLTTSPSTNVSVRILNLSAYNLTIDSSSSINVSGKGYPAVTTTQTNGSGPGYGASYGNNGCAGSGSYGGAAGVCSSSHDPDGLPYGDLLLPLMAGSSGGTRWTGATPSGAGGGVVFLNITSIANLSGPILADGLSGTTGANPAGSGSGGSILIFTNVLSGNGTISSNGGNGTGSSYYAGGAGGGRIALYYSNFSFNGSVLAKGGAAGGGAAQAGGAGTIFTCQSTGNAQCPGTLGNITLNTIFSVNTSQNITRTVAGTWSNTSINWRDVATNTSTIGSYVIQNLTGIYDVIANGVGVGTYPTGSDILGPFNVSISNTNISVTLSNGLVIYYVNITPTIAYRGTTLQGWCNGTANTATVSYYYSWYKNGTLNVSGYANNGGAEYTKDLLVNVANLSGENLTKGDAWTFSCIITNGTDNSSLITSAAVNILNAVPTISSLILNSTYGFNTTLENITAQITPYDIDADAVRTIVDWRLNGSSIAVVNMNFDLNDSAGINKTKDYSMYANNGTLLTGTATPLWNATGGWNGTGAYYFDGGDTINVSIAQTVKDRYTISFWAKPSSVQTTIVLSTRSPTEYGTDIQFSASGLHGDIGNGASWIVTNANAGFTYSANNWYHIVYAINTTSYTIYVNGTQVAQSTYTAASPLFSDASHMLRIGAASYNGYVDNLVVYNKTLSAQEIAAIYNNQMNKIVTQELAIGQNWSVCVTPNDGYSDGGTNCSGNITITNSIPSTTVFINSTSGLNTTNDNITAYVTATDADNDPVRVAYDWRINNASIALLSMNFDVNDSAGSSKTRDYSTYQNNGTVVGAVWNATGGWNTTGSYQFTGGDSTAVVPAAIDLNGSSFTLAAWTKRSSTGTDNIILGGGSTSQYNGLYFGYRNTDVFTLSFFNADLNTPSTYTDTTNWHYWVATYNSVTNNGSIYYDGQYVTSAIAPSDYLSNLSIIGNVPWGGGGFNGSIDNVQIYNRSLSAQEIAIIYSNQSNRMVSQELQAGQNWNVCITPNDGKVDGNTVCSNTLAISGYYSNCPSVTGDWTVSTSQALNTNISCRNVVINSGAILTINNNASINASTITITGSSTITTGLRAIVNLTAENITIASGSSISVVGKGLSEGTGPGNGTTGPYQKGAGGAAHAGYGGQGGSSGGAGSTITHGDAVLPILFGSGGGIGYNGAGGTGGGIIRIFASNTLTNNGTISANANDGTNGGSFGSGGGGAGGSIIINTSTFTGTGTINANGGAGGGGSYIGGAGSGGRISISYATSSYSGLLDSKGGTGSANGGAGTVYLLDKNTNTDTIIVNNYNIGIISTNITGSSTKASYSNIVLNGTNVLCTTLNITNSITTMPGTANIQCAITGSSNITFNQTTTTIASTVDCNNLLSISSTVTTTNSFSFNVNDTFSIKSSSLTTSSSLIPMTITATNALIDSGSSINAAGKGYGSNGGPSPGGSGGAATTGGGAHGGNGGTAGTTGGTPPYGDMILPITYGSGSGGNGWQGGSSGGGAIRITARLIENNGTLNSNGNAGTCSAYSSGGGAGGSIALNAITISGTGTITAAGGNGCSGSGGGGGGRIGMNYNNYSYSGTINVAAGTGGSGAGAGTVFRCQASGNMTCPGTFNNGSTVITLNTAYSINSSQNITRNLTTEWSNMSMNWSEAATNTATIGTYTLQNLNDNMKYSILRNNTNTGTYTVTSNILGPFNVSLSKVNIAVTYLQSSCFPSNGQNWQVDAADNCTITNQAIDVKNISITGTGSFTVRNSTIKSTGCRISPTIGANIILAVGMNTTWSNSCY